MARSKRSAARPETTTDIRKALAELGPPTDEMLLGNDMAKALRQIDASLKRGKTSPREIQPLLDRLLTRGEPPLLHTRGGGFSDVVARDSQSIFQLLNGLYLPVDVHPAWVVTGHRYYLDQTWPGVGGSASAYKGNGKLTAIQMATVNANQAFTDAGVYILLKTDLAHYGQVSRIAFEPEIDWMGRDHFDVDFVWISRIDGTVWFTNRIWVVVYELNLATGKFEPLNSPSAVAHQVSQSSWYINSGGMTAHSGSLRHGAAAFQFIASPGRTYLMGVVTRMGVSHNLRNVDGGPITPPTSGQFVAYGLSKVDVPAMWVEHQVLAK